MAKDATRIGDTSGRRLITKKLIRAGDATINMTGFWMMSIPGKCGVGRVFLDKWLQEVFVVQQFIDDRQFKRQFANLFRKYGIYQFQLANEVRLMEGTRTELVVPGERGTKKNRPRSYRMKALLPSSACRRISARRWKKRS